MSQNLDATAINQIHALISAQGVNEIISKIGADAVALPENFRIHDLEKFNLNRFRFRGALSTASIDDFTRYSKDLADEGTRCFIDADNMRAVSVLNLGTIDEPGHADNTATLKLKKTAPFSALLSVNGERNICRFAGHLSHFYSVAQHAVLCSQLVPQEFAFEALMHDATEAYCQDIPAPLKRLLPDYKRMEEKIDAVIREKYGLPPVMSTPVKYADLIMLATERRDLGLDDGSFWPVLEGIPATEMFKVIPLSPGHAYGMFMERFNELSELRKCA